MLKQENLAANFCGLLTRHNNYRKSAVEWRILGQEQDGSMLASWISLSMNETPIEQSHIGVYNPIEKSFRILYSFGKRENCIQATVNSSRTLLSFVLKDAQTKLNDTETTVEWIYTPYIVEVKDDPNEPLIRKSLLADGSHRQIMTQFLWQKKSIFEKTYEDKLLLFVHDDYIAILKTKLMKYMNGSDDNSDSCRIDLHNSDTWCLDFDGITREIIVKHFIWAQYDPIQLALYYIHLKPTTKGSLEKDDDKAKDSEFTTTLSAHQFHENSPRETVVS